MREYTLSLLIIKQYIYMPLYIETLDKCGNLKGRADRREFWEFLLINLTVVILIFSLKDFFGVSNSFLFGILAFFFVLNFSVGVRRLHDLGHSGKWALFLFIPIINLALLAFCTKQGHRVNNIYGAPI